MTSDGAAQISAEGKATTNFDEVHYVTIGGVQYPIILPSAIITRVYNLTERREYKGLTNGVLHSQGKTVQIRVEGKNLDKYNPVLTVDDSEEPLTLDVINKDYVIAHTDDSTEWLDVTLLDKKYTYVRHSDNKTLPTVSSVGMNGRGISSLYGIIIIEDANVDYNVDIVVVGEKLKNASFSSGADDDITPIVPKRIASDGKSAIIPVINDGKEMLTITGADNSLSYVFFRIHSQMPIADYRINGIADGGYGKLPAAVEGSVKIPVVCDRKLAEDFHYISMYIPGVTEPKAIEFADGIGYVTLTTAEAKPGVYTVAVDSALVPLCSVELMA